MQCKCNIKCNKNAIKALLNTLYTLIICLYACKYHDLVFVVQTLYVLGNVKLIKVKLVFIMHTCNTCCF